MRNIIHMHRSSRPLWAGIVVCGILLAGLVVAPASEGAAVAAEPATAVATRDVADAAVGVEDTAIRPQSLVGFRPGNIIEDAVFFAKDTMSVQQIQAFLDSKVSNCRSGYICLKNYGMPTTSRAASAYCLSPYTGQGWETAAQIIFNVAQACGINPQVLLVTLQKEQGLVTHTEPTDLRYRKAMGQGCPDTAACDVAYYGFFNQVYGAAQQFKIYGVSQNFKYYAPGRTWNVRFNPNAACGTSPVYIENQATANLYYYTPYQPNAAALASGYSTGDGCSSYGNRNFYNYFTDWFGSTRATNVNLVKTEKSPTVYLVSGVWRWSIADYEDYVELNRVLGPTFTVGETFINERTSAGAASTVLRDETTGEMSLVQDGARHKLATCEMVSQWGGTCAAPVNVSPFLVNRIPVGADATSFFRVRGSNQLGRFDSPSIASPMWDPAAAAAANGTPASAPTALTISAARYGSLTKRPMVFAPGRLVKSAESAQVYMTVDFGGLRKVPAWSDVVEYGLTGADIAVVSSAELFARYTDAGSVAPTITCSGAAYFAASGVLYPLADPSATGLATMESPPSTCAQFPKGSAGGSALFIKSASAPWVYVVEAGKKSVVGDWRLLLEQNNGVTPRIIIVRDTTVNSLASARGHFDGLVIKGASAATMFLVNGSTLQPITSGAAAGDLGLNLTSYVTVSDAEVALQQVGSPLGMWYSCGSDIFVGYGGALRQVTADAAAGFSPMPLTAASCAVFKKAPSLSTRAFFMTAGQPQVYVAENGVYRLIPNWQTLLSLAGGTVPEIAILSPSVINSLPKGSPIA